MGPIPATWQLLGNSNTLNNTHTLKSLTVIFQCHVGKWEGESLTIRSFCNRGSEPGQVAQVEQRHLIQTELLETRQVYKKTQECLEIEIIKAVTVSMGINEKCGIF